MRTSGRALRPAFAGATLFFSTGAEAHGFGRLYNLPVPFWLYAWGAAGALIVSFVIVAWYMAQPARTAGETSRDVSRSSWVAALARALPALKIVSLLTLLLSIATGWFGNRDPYRNFSMTFFWIWFLLGFTYLTALIGDVYSSINPWRVMVDALDRAAPGFARGRIGYPQRLACWPALALYYGLIAFELFGHGRPSSLATALFAYTVLNVSGAWLVGASSWFHYCEFTGVFLRRVALAAPLDYRRADQGSGTLLFRAPLSGFARGRAESISEVVFVLFMLASTAFDGLSVTQAWVYAFWQSGWVGSWIGRAPVNAIAQLWPWYEAFDLLCLAALPFVYLGAYWLVLAIARRLTRCQQPVRELVLDFAYPLLPIALVYNFTHYFTLLLSQGPQIIGLLSDPFGWNWNLFGTAGLFAAPILPALGLVWHAQVLLIVAGHVASVHLAHRVALRVFPTRREAVLSQPPMLALMVGFTVAGLWILAQPLTAVLMR